MKKPWFLAVERNPFYVTRKALFGRPLFCLRVTHRVKKTRLRVTFSLGTQHNRVRNAP